MNFELQLCYLQIMLGSAKVLPGITFTAKTVLDVHIFTEKNPIPESMVADYIFDTSSSSQNSALVSRNQPLKRDLFPKPLANSKLPHRDITMQNVIGEGDFDHYQGLW